MDKPEGPKPDESKNWKDYSFGYLRDDEHPAPERVRTGEEWNFPPCRCTTFSHGPEKAAQHGDHHDPSCPQFAEHPASAEPAMCPTCGLPHPIVGGEPRNCFDLFHAPTPPTRSEVRACSVCEPPCQYLRHLQRLYGESAPLLLSAEEVHIDGSNSGDVEAALALVRDLDTSLRAVVKERDEMRDDWRHCCVEERQAKADLAASTEREERLHAENERLRGALVDMVGQFAYENNTPTTNFDPTTGRLFTTEEMDAKMRASTIHTGGLSALEMAFEVLGLADPSPRSALAPSDPAVASCPCEPPCSNPKECEFPWK